MPNINITDSRKRDAVVKAENTTLQEDVRYVDADGSVASTRKVLKATVAHDYDTLSRQFGDDPEKLGLALIDGDPEVDMERCGVFLWGVSKVFVTSDDGIVYRIEQTEKVRDTEGNVKETRPRRRAEANVDAEIPLTWTGRKIKKTDAIRRFVFTSKLQVVHVNGLTYDFLYGMAKELDEESSLMMIGGGGAGKDPLVFRRGSVPYRGFLEGRVQGDQYILLLHLSNMELKVPESASDASATEKETAKAKEKTQVKEEVTQDKPKQVKAEKEKPAKAKRSEDKKESIEDVPAPASSGKSSATTDHAAQSAKKKSSAKKVFEKKPDTEDKKDEAVLSDDASERKEPQAKTYDRVADEKVTQKPYKTANPQSVNTEDLGVWLKSIRMGKYLELFIANEIDVDVLSELSDEDLKELDIPLGSRRRLLKAVSEADNLRAEVAMAVSKISRSTAQPRTEKTKKKKVKKKKVSAKKSDKG